MYLRAKKRIKDGKEHRYWSIVESCRNLDGRVVQRQVLYLGEINDSQKAAWCRTIDVLQTDSSAKQMALFPTDRQAPELDCEVVQVNLNELRLHHPRQWGACWLALKLWEQLELDRFWQPRLPVSRQGTKWLEVLKTQVCYQLIDPGSEWRLHRHWYRQRRAPRARRRGAAAMNLPYLLVPYELSDEAAAYVSELLNDLAVAFDGQYFAQVRRYYDERRDIERFCHDGQLDLFDYDDVEF